MDINQIKSQTTTLSLTAYIDLLGFSSHLIMSNYDLRTKIGEEAILRLKIIENAVELIRRELDLFPSYYPETFRFMRFNDALILGLDIHPPILPKIGKPNEGDSFSYNDIKDFYNQELKPLELSKKVQEDFDSEAYKICQFLGIAARIHNYINKFEYEAQMPGCRTVISTGLRYKFFNNKGIEDYYSANFSFSNAYLTNEIGSKGGISGNKCYIENNVAGICSLNLYASRLIGFAKYKMNYLIKDPFEGTSNLYLKTISYSEVKPIQIELFNKSYIFREVNTSFLSNFQIIQDLIKFVDIKVDAKNTLLANILNMIKNDTPNLSEQYAIENHPHFKYPLLFFTSQLEDNLKEYSDLILKGHSV